ncbi:VOC family protein [Erythrobacter sp. THAF29]|uniref:VOC family protein n=1 Tax=Erythrobacter sp. THAF29 TaxID=2587851 RepID=UPI00126952F3|nr:VOC family protein [Erythrobacter sp. THAF29]QFT78738.1 Glyoxalase-like domain protein [Erythrobacter sp. THAF29]
MAIIGLDHIQIAIPERGEDAAREFYGDLLGMHEVPKPEILSKSGCWFERGSVSLHIGVDPDFVPARKAHPALLVDDLQTLRSRVENAGHTTYDDKPVEGYDRFFTFDPFGNRIEFMQHVKAM